MSESATSHLYAHAAGHGDPLALRAALDALFRADNLRAFRRALLAEAARRGVQRHSVPANLKAARTATAILRALRTHGLWAHHMTYVAGGCDEALDESIAERVGFDRLFGTPAERARAAQTAERRAADAVTEARRNAAWFRKRAEDLHRMNPAGETPPGGEIFAFLGACLGGTAVPASLGQRRPEAGAEVTVDDGEDEGGEDEAKEDKLDDRRSDDVSDGDANDENDDDGPDDNVRVLGGGSSAVLDLDRSSMDDDTDDDTEDGGGDDERGTYTTSLWEARTRAAGLHWYAADTGKCHARTKSKKRCTRGADATGLCAQHRVVVENSVP